MPWDFLMIAFALIYVVSIGVSLLLIMTQTLLIFNEISSFVHDGVWLSSVEKLVQHSFLNALSLSCGGEIILYCLSFTCNTNR